jgi:hypothetical protein
MLPLYKNFKVLDMKKISTSLLLTVLSCLSFNVMAADADKPKDEQQQEQTQDQLPTTKDIKPVVEGDEKKSGK